MTSIFAWIRAYVRETVYDWRDLVEDRIPLRVGERLWDRIRHYPEYVSLKISGLNYVHDLIRIRLVLPL